MFVRSTKKGFTLLEILLTLVLFAIGCVGIAGFFGYALESSLDAEYTEIAVSLAQARMEEVRNIAYDSIADEAKAPITDRLSLPPQTFQMFQREVIVVTPQAFPDLKQITVTIYWQFKGKVVNEPLVTYVSKN